MGNTVYRIEELRDKIVALLRKQKGAVTRDAIAHDLDLPAYAVDAGLESALLGDLVEFAAGQGYWIKAGAAQ